jgi:hypothetical protein
MIMSSVSGVMATARHSLEMMQAALTRTDGDDDDGVGQYTCVSALTTAASITAGWRDDDNDVDTICRY